METHLTDLVYCRRLVFFMDNYLGIIINMYPHKMFVNIKSIITVIYFVVFPISAISLPSFCFNKKVYNYILLLGFNIIFLSTNTLKYVSWEFLPLEIKKNLNISIKNLHKYDIFLLVISSRENVGELVLYLWEVSPDFQRYTNITRKISTKLLFS